MKYAVVTTFHKEGYYLYGQRMIQTFIQNWPTEVTLYVYHQDVNPREASLNVIMRDLNSVKALNDFKTKWKINLHSFIIIIIIIIIILLIIIKIILTTIIFTKLWRK